MIQPHGTFSTVLTAPPGGIAVTVLRIRSYQSVEILTRRRGFDALEVLTKAAFRPQILPGGGREGRGPQDGRNQRGQVGVRAGMRGPTAADAAPGQSKPPALARPGEIVEHASCRTGGARPAGLYPSPYFFIFAWRPVRDRPRTSDAACLFQPVLESASRIRLFSSASTSSLRERRCGSSSPRLTS
jgi:hypothetical protein